MKFRIKHADQVVGAFIILAIVALMAALVFVGINKRWFAKNYYFKTEFNSASNISPGTSINFKGFVIGKISKTKLNDRNTVDVDFYIYDTYYSLVKEFSILELSVSPIGLGSALYFHQGLGSQVLPEGSFINRFSSEAGQAIVDAELVDMPVKDDTIARLLGSVNPLLENANRLIVELRKTAVELTGAFSGSGSGPLSQTLRGASASVSSLQSLMASINRDLPGIMADLSVVMGNANKITDDLKGMSGEFRDPTGLVTRLLGAKGSIPSLLDDGNALYARITNMMTTVDSALASVGSMTSRLDSQMPNISILLEDTKATLKKAQDVLEGLKNNPLLRGGIPEAKEQESLIRSSRDTEF